MKHEEKACVMIEKSNFTNCNVTRNIIDSVGDALDVTDCYNVTSLILYNSKFENNSAIYLISEMNGVIANIRLHNCMFENNDVRKALLQNNYATLNMTDTTVRDHLLVVESNDISTPATYEILLQNTRFDNNSISETGEIDEQHGGAAIGWFIESTSKSILEVEHCKWSYLIQNCLLHMYCLLWSWN